MQNIYVVRGTEQSGPFTEAEVRAQLASGALTGDSMVWWEGLAEWTPISKTPLGAPAATAPVATPPGTAAVSVPAAALADPGAKKNSGLAIASLILGIVGILCAPILGVAAVVTGHMARSQIRKDPSQSGSGLALAGLILGYLWIVLFIIGIIADIFLFSMGNNVKDIFSTIKSQLNQAAMTNNASATPDSDANSSATQGSETNSPSTNSAPVTPDTGSPATNSAPVTPSADTNSPAPTTAPASQ